MSLQSERMKAGFSQQGLANASGVSIWNIRHYEQGTRNIDGAGLDVLCKLASVIGCTIYDLLESEELKELLKQVT
ncbi:MAG: helix-turn-helix transcriptional regulator [Bacteroidaceae bacterium]|nr:helix-turn-helix transcriptional regulator [Bacteroidaceae bacterium]